ncbi:MAG: 5'-3' exonuclease [Aquificae bacterium]|nr:5'-3' exonuclease [Aquificota bacterium]
MKTLYLLDGSSFVYRSFFALPRLSTSRGFPTNAIYGFLRMLFALMKKEKPRYMAVVFDAPAKTKRETIYRAYKQQRPKTPDPLKVQIPVIKELLRLMGIKVLEVPGYEADDVIAYLAEQFSRKSFRVKVFSPDKDLLQLVSDKVLVVNPVNWEVYDPNKVREKFGVEPQKVPDFLALVGDPVDNVPGVKGVGPKKAPELIRRFGGVEGILRNWEKFARLYPQAKREELELSYKLVRLYTDLNLEISEEDLRLSKPDLKALKEKLSELEMKSLLREVDRVFSQSTQSSLF